MAFCERWAVRLILRAQGLEFPDDRPSDKSAGAGAVWTFQTDQPFRPLESDGRLDFPDAAQGSVWNFQMD